MDRVFKDFKTIPLEEMKRRDFLKLCGVGALPGLLAACQSGQGMPSVTGQKQGSAPTRPPSLTNQLSSTRQADPTRKPSPTEADWIALARNLQGTLVRPDSPQYPVALQLFDPRFDSILPAAIAYCVSPADVQTCLAFAQRFAVPIAARAGRHSYAGYSTTTGLVVDVTRMNTVAVNPGSESARVGAGARLIDVYAMLSQYGFALPGGSCATVGIAGLTLGGGVGVLGRKFGLTSDNLLAAQVVVADGRILACDASRNPDLFWALRGGGGGNFGVVTSFTFRVHPVSTLSLFTLRWPWGSAATVVDAWQRWAPPAPDELWSNCVLQASRDPNINPIVEVGGVYVGDVGPLNSLLNRLTNQIDAAPISRYASSAGLLQTMLDEAGCSEKTVSECHLPSQNPQGLLIRAAYSSKSDFFTSLLPRQGIDKMVNAVARSQFTSTLGQGGIGLDAFGGAINRVDPSVTAFVHRNALFSAQYTANWRGSDPTSIVAANLTWLRETWQSMRPYASRAAYQNYIDPDLPNWERAYYGANLPRLQKVKAAYDPGDLFHFAQSIPLPG
jgi:FAD/FMN-containing dehydrogenase